MTYLDYDALEATPLVRDPYDFLIVENFIVKAGIRKSEFQKAFFSKRNEKILHFFLMKASFKSLSRLNKECGQISWVESGEGFECFKLSYCFKVCVNEMKFVQ